MIDPRAIQTLGIGYGAKALVSLGFKWFDIEVIPPFIEGTGGGIITSQTPAKLIITVRYNGKVKRNEYDISDYFYKAISISVNYIDKLRFAIGAISQSVSKVIAKVKLTNVDTVKPEIRVKEAKPNFFIRRKK